ncbi:site-2 protease family protein [Alkaliphilus serpentinus]|uniref:Site-2 protease family protein n=1 Tax=Alkaliphilus serpentinus TaxID=1482731 RepID=A0A833HMB0_9FIRM|nr:site-2 protease family protein [Alkaliphilus serpentinus]KAB3527368.1 site-2 protease family protein [Alkaliphilus serpentinus]
MFDFDLYSTVLRLPGIVIGLTLHEFAHGFSAYLLGDTTAKDQGRLTIDPKAHIDVFGFLMLLFAGFGWAKPVPINPNRFTNRKLGTFIVSIAGVTTNMILALLLTLILGITLKFYYNETLTNILLYAISINIVLAVFNLFPIPPLDGSKVLLSFLPQRFEYYYYNYERYAYFILLALILFDIIDIVLFPIVDFFMNYAIQLIVLIGG